MDQYEKLEMENWKKESYNKTKISTSRAFTWTKIIHKKL